MKAADKYKGKEGVVNVANIKEIFPKGVPINHKYAHFASARRARAVRSGCCNTADSGCSTRNCVDLGIPERMACRLMGSDHRTSRHDILVRRAEKEGNKIGRFIRDTGGDAVVEATILFPIMTMIFAALVLLAVYLPTQSVLQRATQFAATAIATESSDTWLFFDEGEMSFYWETDKHRLKNVYVELFSSLSEDEITARAEEIVTKMESRSISSKAGELSVKGSLVNNIFYKEIIVTASREYRMPESLSFVGFPETFTVTVTSTAAVQNANEFVRSIDIADDFARYIIDKYELHGIMDAISSFGGKVASLLGW